MTEPQATSTARLLSGGVKKIRHRARKERLRRFTALLVLASFFGATAHFAVGCDGWDPLDPLQHRAPEVEEALAQMGSGDYRSAEQTLADFLGTGVCKGKTIGLPDTVRQRPDGSFDLGIVLFFLSEKYGRKFGDEEKADPGKIEDPEMTEQRSNEIDCAEIIVNAIAKDPSVALELRARAFYLLGNLEFMRKKYKEAVGYYDQALRLIPGLVEEAGGDGIGRDAAWNRAIALRRIDDKKDAGQDAADEPDSSDGDDGNDGSDGAPDADDGNDGGGPDGSDGDDGNDGSDGSDGGDDNKDGGGDAGTDAGKDSGQDADNQDQTPDAGDPKPPNDKNNPPKSGPPSDGPDQGDPEDGDDQLLDKFEGTPTYQQEEAKRRGGGPRTMEDK